MLWIWYRLQVIELPDVWDYDLLFSQLKAELQNEGGTADASKDGKQQLMNLFMLACCCALAHDRGTTIGDHVHNYLHQALASGSELLGSSASVLCPCCTGRAA